MATLAIGMATGSQAHGNDDEVSRDHGWGPGFAVWLEPGVFADLGHALQEILDGLPREHKGFTWQRPPRHTCPVLNLNEYLEQLIGFSHAPKEPVEWLRIPEAYLFEVTLDRLFFDRPGITTARFNEFNYYPDDVWLKRLSTWLSWVAEFGDKHLLRAWNRGDHFTAQLYASKYVEAVIRAVFLLNKRYAPYEKWLHREFVQLPDLSADIDPLLFRLLSQEDPNSLVDDIADVLSRSLRALGVIPITSDSVPNYPSVLRGFVRGLQESIRDQAIATMRTYSDLVLPPKKPSWTYAMTPA